MEIKTHWIEQMDTTIETMRRQCLGYYDQGVQAVTSVVTAIDRGREIAEPAIKNAQEYATAAISVTDRLDKLSTDTKNVLVEFYLGIAVLLMGAGCGELAGATTLAPLLDSIFHPFVEVFLLILVPLYAYVVTKKTPTMDDTERRARLFQATTTMGVLLGHLCPKVISLVPAILFLQPLILGLVLDNALIQTPFVSNRHLYLVAAGVISVSISVLSSCLPLGHFSLTITIIAILHGIFAAIHFQVSTACLRDNLFLVKEATLAYILPLFLIQLMWASMFGILSE